MNIKQLKKYVPENHGEHGVDSLIHSLLKATSFSREVFSNLPGGSWTEFDIYDPKKKARYKWDHIPRVTKSKRPDAVFQEMETSRYSFFLIESKKKISDLETNIGNRLKDYLISKKGLFNKPAWQKKEHHSDTWKIIDLNDQERYWFKNIDASKVDLFSGYAYGLNQEINQYSEQLVADEIIKQKEIYKTDNALDMIFGIFWFGETRRPYIIYTQNEKLSNNLFGKKISSLIQKFNDYQLSKRDS